jgi:Flp pilus assembly protein TadD
LSPEDLTRRANSQDGASKRELAGLFDLFASEYAYQPVDPAQVPYGERAAAFAQAKTCRYVLHNYGAIQSLERLMGLLDPQGFILINDYGSSEAKDYAAGFEHQRYGDSVFVGINFPLLEEHFRGRRGCRWIAPSEDNGHIYSRMVATDVHPAAAEQFQKLFGKARFEWKHEPAQTAMSCIKAGRFESAAIALREALERQPYNWMLMSEVAKFLTYSLRDPKAGFEMTRAALALNPCSPELWNTLGDALFVQERVSEARGAFVRALELDPQDVRARYNLSFVFVHERDYPSALKVIAEALALDTMGVCRDGLLRQQAEILERIAGRYREQGFRMANRVTDTARSLQQEPSAHAAGSAGAHWNAVRQQ